LAAASSPFVVFKGRRITIKGSFLAVYESLILDSAKPVIMCITAGQFVLSLSMPDPAMVFKSFNYARESILLRQAYRLLHIIIRQATTPSYGLFSVRSRRSLSAAEQSEMRLEADDEGLPVIADVETEIAGHTTETLELVRRLFLKHPLLLMLHSKLAELYELRSGIPANAAPRSNGRKQATKKMFTQVAKRLKELRAKGSTHKAGLLWQHMFAEEVASGMTTTYFLLGVRMAGLVRPLWLQQQPREQALILKAALSALGKPRLPLQYTPEESELLRALVGLVRTRIA
jgi:hypothetical protein